jgi:GH3 auxin-responsive promoter
LETRNTSKDMTRLGYFEAVKADRQSLDAALGDARAVQQRLLQEYIAANADTEFGREHRFATIRTVDDYRRAVPIRTYDEFSSYCERAARGEPAVLTHASPFTFVLTSGTTGFAKTLPCTLADWRARASARRACLFEQLVSMPECLERNDTIFFLGMDKKEEAQFTAGGLPLVCLTELRPPEPTPRPRWGEAPWLRIPKSVVDVSVRARIALRLAVEADLLGIGAVHPVRFAQLARELPEALAGFIAEIRDGTVEGARARDPNPTRARELEEVLRGGVTLPRVWKRLRFARCWTGGSAAAYLPILRQMLDDAVPILPLGLTASEGTITLTGTAPGSPVAGLAAINTHFFEYLPADAEPLADAETLLAHELEVGQRYQVVVTQASGLYRYAIGDVVRVVEMKKDVPRLDFVGRRRTTSLANEKLTEAQLMTAVTAACEATGVSVGQYLYCPAGSELPPFYRLLLECPNGIGGDLRERLEHALDTALTNGNESYAVFRKEGCLGPARVHLLPSGALSRHWERQLLAAANSAQFKPPLVDPGGAAWRELGGPSEAPRGRPLDVR